MKFLSVLSIVSLFCAGAVFAQSNDVLISTSGVAISSGAMYVNDCFDKNANKEDTYVACFGAALFSAGLTTAATIKEHHKLDIEQIKSEAIAFLAGESMTDALAEQFEKIRELSDESAKLTDEEIALGILSLN